MAPARVFNGVAVAAFALILPAGVLFSVLMLFTPAFAGPEMFPTTTSFVIWCLIIILPAANFATLREFPRRVSSPPMLLTVSGGVLLAQYALFELMTSRYPLAAID